MEYFELIATTTFGLEAVVRREIEQLGFTVLSTENGKVTFKSDLSGIAKANLWLRCADRVLLQVAQFRAVTFDELFDQTAAIDWSRYIAKDGAFPVNGKSVKSTLFSISDSQAIVKKAIVKSLSASYGIAWFPESGSLHTVQVSLLNDIATITLDTSGAALHKRGYREKAVAAPLKETLAAAMIQLSYWNSGRMLVDPFCGSGTIPIEAAMIARNIAPGLSRDFAFRHWRFVEEAVWKEETRKAYEAMKPDLPLKIHASDSDPLAIVAAKENAEAAGVDDAIVFEEIRFENLRFTEDYGVLITNPPYGERLNEQTSLRPLYLRLAERIADLKTWSAYVITSWPDFAVLGSRQPDRERKLYNGNIETHYYQFMGPKPPLKETTGSSR